MCTVILQPLLSDRDYLAHACLFRFKFSQSEQLAQPSWYLIGLCSGQLQTYDTIGVVRWYTPPEVHGVDGDKRWLFELAQE